MIVPQNDNHALLLECVINNNILVNQQKFSSNLYNVCGSLSRFAVTCM
jgi:hypothetical protein